MTTSPDAAPENPASHSGSEMHGESRDSSKFFQIDQVHLSLPEDGFDADALAALSPRVAARQVTRIPHERAAVLLARASASVSAEVLQVLLPENEGLVISILASISQGRAQEIVAEMASTTRLEQLPSAVKAIEDCERTAREALGESVGPLARATPSRQHTEGFYQAFEKGQILWSARGEAQVTWGAIAEYYITLGGTGGRLGFPLTPDHKAVASPFGTEGSCQRFEGLRDYPQEVCERIGRCGATVYWSQKYWTHGTWGSIGAYYELVGGTGGWLGFPVADEVKVGPSQREAGDGTTGWRQRFEGGAVYYSGKTRAIAVHEPVADYHESHRGVTSPRGFPVSPELAAADSPYGTTGRLQRFEGIWDYPTDILDHWSDVEGPGGATIYTSEAHGVYCVGWGNGILYERLGGTGSWLGFPKSDETDARASKDDPWCTVQEFEGGTIFYKAKSGSVPVPRATMEYLSQHEGLLQRLGLPVKGESSLTPGDDEHVQFFEHGVVTIRKGVFETWLRAENT